MISLGQLLYLSCFTASFYLVLWLVLIVHAAVKSEW